MCGIVGYIGQNDVKEILLTGLEKLEYRGYDSAGIAVYNENEGVCIFKDQGRIAHLRSIVEDVPSTMGIGHTRWATHGEPNHVNSHPHQSANKRFTLVHNGVIENEDELREKYFDGFNFVSETDTELVVELFDQFFNQDDGDIEIAIRQLIKVLHGSYALGIIDHENPDVLYAIKNKSPLLIGKGDGFNMIGSDSLAMLKQTNTFYEIDDLEYVKITRDNIEIFEMTGVKVKRDPFVTKIDANDIEKGVYPHFMLKEIDEQPFVIRRIIQEYEKDGKLQIDQEIVDTVKESDRIYIIAAGTSYNAGLIGKQLLEKIGNKPVEVHIASEFVYNTPIVSKKPLFLFVSQSGETADCRAVLVKIKKLGYKSLTLTNVEGSTLSREADYTLLLHAGPEIAVASTKAYTANIAVLTILSALIGDNMNHEELHHELSIVATVIESICDEKELFDEIAGKYLKDTRNCFYIGRHIDYYVALEAALKLKEISYIQTEGFAAGELKHGTIALIEKGTPVIAVISQDEINLNTRSNVKEVKSRGGNTVVISQKSISQKTDQVIIDDVHPTLTPLVTIVPTQLIAYYAALHRDLDIDKPRNLAKSVTVE
ncbi:glutamine--fructose-6-phosphate transaminase (isomerizing) [Haloplasma contractile]|uniref:Glutamine--fructose-6-phosphate aminotransferase [isomerizing] n=1 Tax=Haloplasma contractile SSD-17B TaxID=1033810 RepID=F7PV33_9MOLU|nr:glutamine--fructose-6-phosphate transaminase (isomerizing) [Haloplasma contractile]ERJ11267.1 Glutamine--fructose-6-phosphate aminotransferase isomerizing protein [Haloplasma contractile SSD-17B]